MRIRTIKPEFFTHEGLFELEDQTKLPIRIAFAGLWCAADRAGRFKWEPRRLGVQILPYDKVDFSRVLYALATRGFIRRYRVETRDFGVIPSFSAHQVINNREKESELPEPLEYLNPDAWGTREARVEDAGQGEGKGKEGNMEGKGLHASVSRENEKEVSFKREPRAKTREEFDTFIRECGLFANDAEWLWNKWEANGWVNGKNKIKDWRATVRAWKVQDYFPSQKPDGRCQPWPVKRDGNAPEQEEEDFMAIFLANKAAEDAELYRDHPDNWTPEEIAARQAIENF